MTRSEPLMGTFVTIRTLDDLLDSADDPAIADRVERAFAWFRQVESCCTRFEATSEARCLTARVGVSVPASAILFEAVRFAIAVAEATGGAFDPTVGARMEQRGFNREHRTGQIIRSARGTTDVSFRDVHVDAAARTITVDRPLILDLGAVAKGLAIDLAVKELQPLGSFAIDAGGDLYLGGPGPGGAPWSVGIRHPRQDRRLIDSLAVSNAAVCTSGDYERRSQDDPAAHHILDPRTGECTTGVASVTVVAPTAMAADALATAAFVLGPSEGLRFLEDQGVEGLIVSAALERHATRGIIKAFGGLAILPNAKRPADHRAHHPGRAGRRGRRPPADRAGAG